MLVRAKRRIQEKKKDVSLSWTGTRSLRDYWRHANAVSLVLPGRDPSLRGGRRQGRRRSVVFAWRPSSLGLNTAKKCPTFVCLPPCGPSHCMWDVPREGSSTNVGISWQYSSMPSTNRVYSAGVGSSTCCKVHFCC